MTDADRQPYARFDALIERHAAFVNRLCLLHADGNGNRCAELVQECYIALWHYLPGLREEALPLQERLWVMWHCRSVFSHLRHGKKPPPWMPLDDNMADTLGQPDDDPLRDSIEALASVLTPHEQKALWLMAEGYTVREMAREMNIKHDSAAKLRHRIYTKLRQRFNPGYKKNSDKNNT